MGSLVILIPKYTPSKTYVNSNNVTESQTYNITYVQTGEEYKVEHYGLKVDGINNEYFPYLDSNGLLDTKQFWNKFTSTHIATIVHFCDAYCTYVPGLKCIETSV